MTGAARRALLLAVAGLAATACDRSSRSSERKPAQEPGDSAGSARPEPPPPPAPASPAPAPPPSAPAPTAAQGPIPPKARQLLVAVVKDWEAVEAELSRWERADEKSPWQRVEEPWLGVIGRGAAWGSGLHGEGPPAGQDGARKREGDGRSPAGVFSLGGSFGYAKAAPAEARWPYTPVDKRWVCVDDGTSKLYGTIVDSERVSKDWTSAEQMRRRDALYTWVVEVAHNPARQAGGGSCIFLHVWRKAGESTVGCTAMPKPELERVLTWLRPESAPVFALLPEAAYRALAAEWGLPER